MSEDANIFAKMLGGFKAAGPERDSSLRGARVTPATIAKVRQDQAVDAARREAEAKAAAAIAAIAAERDELKTKFEQLSEDSASDKIVIAQFAAEKAALQNELEEARGATAAAVAGATAAIAAERDALAAALAKAHAERDALAKANDAIRAELEAERRRPHLDEKLAAERDALAAERDGLKTLLAEAHQTSLSSSVLLSKPGQTAERFPGEIREHALAALGEACQKASAEGRERHAAILEAILLENPSSGELENLREAVREALARARGVIDGPAIESLEALGFRRASQMNSRRFRWGNISFSIPETPTSIDELEKLLF